MYIVSYHNLALIFYLSSGYIFPFSHLYILIPPICLVFSCLVLCCLVLCSLVLCCLVLCCLVLCCVVLSCVVLSCLVLCCAEYVLRCAVVLCVCFIGKFFISLSSLFAFYFIRLNLRPIYFGLSP